MNVFSKDVSNLNAPCATNLRTNGLFITALSVLLLLIASEARIPIGAVPITLQTFVVFLLGLRLDKRTSINTGMLFIAIKLMTLSFWSCPSFGYIIGMGFTLPAMCYIRQSTHNQVVNCIAGYFVTNILGAIWLYDFFPDFQLVWRYGIEPFIFIEIFKSVVAIYVSKCLDQRLCKN